MGREGKGGAQKPKHFREDMKLSKGVGREGKGGAQKPKHFKEDMKLS